MLRAIGQKTYSLCWLGGSAACRCAARCGSSGRRRAHNHGDGRGERGRGGPSDESWWRLPPSGRCAPGGCHEERSPAHAERGYGVDPSEPPPTRTSHRDRTLSRPTDQESSLEVTTHQRATEHHPLQGSSAHREHRPPDVEQSFEERARRRGRRSRRTGRPRADGHSRASRTRPIQPAPTPALTYTPPPSRGTGARANADTPRTTEPLQAE